MSNDKDKIRDMVLALSRGDHDAANKASAEVIANKTADIVNETQNSSTEINDENSKSRKKPRFDNTFCSQGGGEFGPGDNGFSHCENHKGMHNYDND
jgi:hypothetical protein